MCLSDVTSRCFAGVKYSQQILCDTVSSSRGGGAERVGRLVVSPVQLEPSHTLLETQNPKQVSQVSLPPSLGLIL